MANLHPEFQVFNGEIRLTDARRKELKKSRKSLRDKIRKWYKENKPDEPTPKFSGQGSMAMDTIINPIPRYKTVNGKETKILYYDVDDGIYNVGNKSPHERHTPATYHSWIIRAVSGHTDIPPVDKNTCVRTIFADGHNIDHPIYYLQGDIPELAHKLDGWKFSDPKAFTDWFLNQMDADNQLRRIVRYLKAWADFREYCNESQSMPSGMILTILAANNFVSNKRDDVALKETLQKIHSSLSQSFVCNRPTIPFNENLLADYTQKDYFMKWLKSFLDDATEDRKSVV